MDNDLKNIIKIVLCLTGIFLFTSIFNNISGRNRQTEIRYQYIPKNNNSIGSRTAGTPF